MTHFNKFLLFLVLIVFASTSLQAQTLIIDKTNENYSESFDIPVTIDSIGFTDFQLQVTTADPSLVINQVILNKKFSKGTLKFSSTGSNYSIAYASETPISISKKEKLFDLKVNTTHRFSDETLILLKEIHFSNNLEPISVIGKVKASTVNQFVLFKNDAIVFGLLMLALGFVFYTTK